MSDRFSRRITEGAVSRRTMLRMLGAGGAGVMLTACGGGHGSSSGSQGATGFKIPDSGSRLPTGNVTLRWMDSGGQKAVFFKEFFPAYQRKHPNIQVRYDASNWNQVTQVVTLGMRNGTAPDVFQLPLGMTVARAVGADWLRPLDDFVPHWPELKKGFPVGVFVPGVTDFNGKSYVYPFTSNRYVGNLLLYNQDYLHRAGYDPGSKVLSWDEFRAAARKCTGQGDGRYYGFIIGVAQSGQLPGFVDTLAEMAGAAGGAFNFKTGVYNYTSDTYLAAIDLLLALKSDGSVFPGSISLDAPGARGRFPQGLAAMILQGPWNIGIWSRENKGFKFGFNLPPQHDPKDILPQSKPPGGSNNYCFSARSDLGAVVGDIYTYLGSPHGQAMWASYDGAADPPQFPQALNSAHLDAMQLRAIKIGMEWSRLRPEPAVRNPQVADVYQELRPVTPGYNDTLLGLLTGQIKGVKKAMQDLTDRTEADLERAIKVVQQRGGKVSRSDWVFPDWDPRQNYSSLYK